MLLFSPLCGATDAMPGGSGAEALGSSEAGLLAYADAHSAELQALVLDYQATQARADAAGRWADPEVEIELRDIPRDRMSLLPYESGSTRYLFKQALPFAGKRALEKRIAATEVERAAAQRAGASRSLHQRVRESYARYWFAQRALERLGELESGLDALDALAQSRYRSGLASQQEAIRTRIERLQSQRQRMQLETQRDQAKALLNAALGRAPDAPLAPPRLAPAEPALTDLGALQRELRDTHPALQNAQSALDGAELSSQLARRSRFPDLVLGVAPIQSGNSLTAFDVMLGFSLPLQRDRRHAEERAAALTARAAAARRDAAAAQLGGQLADSWAQRQSAVRQLSLLRESLLPVANGNYETAMAGYRLGRAELADALDALRQANELQQELLAMQLELRLRTLDIEALTGESS